MEKWIINLRTDELTRFFKLMPFFASDYFYIIVIATCYWFKPEKKVFKDLGFLVAFSTLVTAILKNLFAIPRPDKVLHLTEVRDSYGFPSGDVLVAVVFWVLLCQEFRSTLLKLWSAILIALIFLSRIYLGVHSLAQVTGGLVFGTIILLGWSLSRNFTERWYEGRVLSFWVMLSALWIVYEWLHFTVAPSLMGLVSLGSLVGYGLSLPYLGREGLPLAVTAKSVALVVTSLIALVFLAKFFPVLPTDEASFQISIMLKYAIIIYSVWVIFPLLIRRLALLK